MRPDRVEIEWAAASRPTTMFDKAETVRAARELFTIDEVANRLNCTRSTVQRWFSQAARYPSRQRCEQIKQMIKQRRAER